MSAPLKQHEELENYDTQADTPKYHEFQEFNQNSLKFNELVFFARIALFSVSTVVIAFFLLVLNLAPVWAFLFAALLGLAITSAVSVFIWSLRR